MKQTFVVLTLGCWGKGETIKAAAFQCNKNGGSGNVVVRLLVGGTEADHKSIAVNGYGDVCYRGEMEIIRILSPEDGHKVKLSNLLGKK